MTINKEDVPLRCYSPLCLFNSALSLCSLYKLVQKVTPIIVDGACLLARRKVPKKRCKAGCDCYFCQTDKLRAETAGKDVPTNE